MQSEVDMKLAHQLQREYLQNHLRQVQESPNITLPLIDFDIRNPQQTFYKQFSRMNNSYLQSHIGLRVARLSREQEDLTFYCLAYLSAEIDIPLKVLVVNANEVWVEIALLKKQAEDSEEEAENQKKAYRFLQETRDRLQRFIAQNVVWERMIKEDYKDTKVIQQFKEEIINPMKQQFKSIMKKN